MKIHLLIVFLSLTLSFSIMGAELEHRNSSLNHKKKKINRELRKIPLHNSNTSGWSWIDWELIIEYADFFSEYEEAPLASSVYGYPYPLNSWNKLGTTSKIRVVKLDTVQGISGDTVVGKYSTEYITTLNSVGNPEEQISSAWDTTSGSWVKRYRETFSYNDKGNIVEIGCFNWNSVDSSWGDSDSRTNFFYTDKDNISAKIDYEWDTLSGTFKPEYLCSCYYDLNGNLSYILNNVGSPDYLTKQSATFNTQGELSEMIDFEWNTDSSKWKERNSFTFSYDSKGNLVEEIQYEFDNDTAEEMAKSVWVYNSDGLIVEELDYNWDSDSSAWFCYYKNGFTYNGEGDIVEDIYYIWNPDSNSWVFNKDNGKNIFHYNSKGQPLVVSLLRYSADTGELSENIGYAVYCEYSNAINPWQSFSNISLSSSVRIKKTSRALVITVDKIAHKGDVMKVYDLQGREIAACYPQRSDGKSLYQWNYRNGKGNTFANQVFIVAIKSGDSHYRLKQVFVP